MTKKDRALYVQRAQDTELGKLVRRRIKTLKLSREALATELGVSVSRVSQLFGYGREHYPRMDFLMRLARALDVPRTTVEKAAMASLERRDG